MQANDSLYIGPTCSKISQGCSSKTKLSKQRSCNPQASFCALEYGKYNKVLITFSSTLDDTFRQVGGVAEPSKCSTPYDWSIVAKRTLPYFPFGDVDEQDSRYISRFIRVRRVLFAIRQKFVKVTKQKTCQQFGNFILCYLFCLLNWMINNACNTSKILSNEKKQLFINSPNFILMFFVFAKVSAVVITNFSYYF